MKNYPLITKSKLSRYIALAGVVLLNSCSDNDEVVVPEKFEEKIVVANRGAGSVSFINAETNNVVKTLSIPNSEPMYIVYVPKKDKIYVGDRIGKKIYVINPQNQQVETSIDVGEGVFHMWADGQGKELWVSNDIDNTISVIDLNTNSVVTTINVGGKPHDVFLTHDGETAFVSIITNDSISDKIFKYSVPNHIKTGEINVGKDPHLFHLTTNNTLYSPCQSGQLYSINPDTFSIISQKNFSGAHGIFPSPSQSTLFVSNISGNQIYSINSSTVNQISNPVPSAGNNPHNITVNAMGNKMFVTHSGTSAKTVSVYNITLSGPISYTSTITVENNPFGLVYYKRKIK